MYLDIDVCFAFNVPYLYIFILTLDSKYFRTLNHVQDSEN